MSSPNIEKVPTTEERALPVFAEFDKVLDRIHERAREIFQQHEFGADTALDDWLMAEREICWPAAELTESDKLLVAKVALPGFKADDITITAAPDVIIVKAATRVEKSEPDTEGETTVRWSEFRSEDVYRRFDMPSEIDVDKLTADFSDGMLTIRASKASDGKAGKRKIPVGKGT